MPEHPDHDPRTPSDASFDGDVEDALTLGLTNRPTADERAVVAELAELDRADRGAGLLGDGDWGIEVAEAAWTRASSATTSWSLVLRVGFMKPI